MERAPYIILALLLILVLIFIGINTFLMPFLKTIEKFGKTEIEINAIEISDPDLKKIYDTVFLLCREGAERTEYVEMGASKEAGDIAKIIAEAVKDCNGEDPSISADRNPDLKYGDGCKGGNNIEYNCGDDNICADNDKTLLINYDSEILTDNVMFCDSDAQ